MAVLDSTRVRRVHSHLTNNLNANSAALDHLRSDLAPSHLSRPLSRFLISRSLQQEHVRTAKDQEWKVVKKYKQLSHI
ncbi:hypothetical protein L596_005890 [Steinernema carpocapsae]|uniref:Uncharacterized protein n=1 Tax=Steinernema carpocapsae TaxID=34508 RepID=A0A4U8V0P8_STECR|nr:hypothetical protein L596_005890 [Steinernema carpocapsae]